MTLNDKYARLKKVLSDMESAVVAFSGGVDSTLLLRVAKDVLGPDRVWAVTVKSPLHPTYEFEQSRVLAAEFGVRQLVAEGRELTLDPVAANVLDRCYHCKKELFSACRRQVADLGCSEILDGSNVDDLNDFRPGRKAVREMGIRSPLLEAGLNKEEIRRLSCELGLPTWDKQPFACLATRFPYGVKITGERLAQVERCEEVLRQREFHNYRVRYHGDAARIEVAPREIPRFFQEDLRRDIIAEFKKAGFTHVALDLQGYRTGSMNESME